MVLLGAPGCGKGTQAEIVSQRLEIPAISTGDMLRRAVEEGSELGQRVQSIMVAGGLVDDDTMAEVVRDRLGREDARRGFLLDGYPRTLDQADTLEEILAEQDRGLDAVIHLDVPEAELVRRALARQRADDREETIKERLRLYHEKTEPLIGYYEARGLLRRVDGFQSIDRVAADLLAVA